MNWKEAQLAKVAEFKEAAAKREDTIQAEAENLQSLLQQEDICLGTLIYELKQDQSQSNQDLEDLFEENQYSFREHRKELVASLRSELSSEESITNDFLRTEQTEKLDGLLTDNKDSMTTITSDRSELSSKQRKAPLNAKATVPTLERKEVYFGSISDVWNHGKEFGFVYFLLLYIAVLLIQLLYDGIINIPIARLVGLDVDSIITERQQQPHYTFGINKSRGEIGNVIDLEIARAMYFCSIVFQIIVHPIASFKILDNGVVSGIKYGCRYFLLHLGLMVATFTCLWVCFELYEITVGIVGFSVAVSLVSCFIQFIPPKPIRKFLELLKHN